jgi:hypothetical protein
VVVARAAKQRQLEEDRRGVDAARQRRQGQFPLTSYEPWQEHVEDTKTFTDYLEDVERRHRQVGQRCRLAAKRRFDDSAGPSGHGEGDFGG